MIPQAVPGDEISLTVNPTSLCLPDSISKSDSFEAEDRYEGPKSEGVEIRHADTTFRVPHQCYEIVST